MGSNCRIMWNNVSSIQIFYSGNIFFKSSTFLFLADFVVLGSAYQRGKVHEEDFRANAVTFLLMSNGSAFIWIFIWTVKLSGSWLQTETEPLFALLTWNGLLLGNQPQTIVVFPPDWELLSHKRALFPMVFIFNARFLNGCSFFFSCFSHQAPLPPGSDVPPSWCPPTLLFRHLQAPLTTLSPSNTYVYGFPSSFFFASLDLFGPLILSLPFHARSFCLHFQT